MLFFSSKECQIKDWPLHRMNCRTLTNQGDHPENISKAEENYATAVFKKNFCLLSVKCNHKTHKIVVNDLEEEMMKLISDTVCIPISQLKLVGGGKVINKDNIQEFVFKKKLRKFMVS